VCSALSESTYVALVLASSRTLSPVDQELPRLTSRLIQLDLERISVPLDKARKSRPVLLHRHTTPNLIPPHLAARLRRIHGDQTTPTVRRQADPERRAGNGLSTGSCAAASPRIRTAAATRGDRAVRQPSSDHLDANYRRGHGRRWIALLGRVLPCGHDRRCTAVLLYSRAVRHAPTPLVRELKTLDR
jgi:hypothetical protein